MKCNNTSPTPKPLTSQTNTAFPPRHPMLPPKPPTSETDRVPSSKYSISETTPSWTTSENSPGHTKIHGMQPWWKPPAYILPHHLQISPLANTMTRTSTSPRSPSSTTKLYGENQATQFMENQQNSPFHQTTQHKPSRTHTYYHSTKMTSTSLYEDTYVHGEKYTSGNPKSVAKNGKYSADQEKKHSYNSQLTTGSIQSTQSYSTPTSKTTGQSQHSTNGTVPTSKPCQPTILVESRTTRTRTEKEQYRTMRLLLQPPCQHKIF